jgi:hypothetical protein
MLTVARIAAGVDGRLVDHCVSASEEHWRQCETDRFRDFRVEEQLSTDHQEGALGGERWQCGGRRQACGETSFAEREISTAGLDASGPDRKTKAFFSCSA